MTTIKEVKAHAKQHGIKARWDSDWQEWTIGTGAAAYHTTDHDDALAQLKFLAGERA